MTLCFDIILYLFGYCKTVPDIMLHVVWIQVTRSKNDRY